MASILHYSVSPGHLDTIRTNLDKELLLNSNYFLKQANVVYWFHLAGAREEAICIRCCRLRQASNYQKGHTDIGLDLTNSKADECLKCQTDYDKKPTTLVHYTHSEGHGDMMRFDQYLSKLEPFEFMAITTELKKICKSGRISHVHSTADKEPNTCGFCCRKHANRRRGYERSELCEECVEESRKPP